MNCPICTAESIRLFQKHGYWIRACKTCQHRFAEIQPVQEHVEKVYGDVYFEGGKDGYPDYLAEADLLQAHGRRYGKLLSKFMEPGHLLDVGCAAGFIMHGLQETGWTVEGVEPNDHMAEHARQQGLQVFTGTLENFQTNDQYDLVTMIQVLPHFYDIKRALAVASEITKQNGYWLVETWNRDSLFARIFGTAWHEYSPPSVLNYFSSGGLKKLAVQYGFNKVAQGRPKKRLSGRHAKSLICYNVKGTSRNHFFQGIVNLIPDQVIIPYPAFDLIWTLFQKSDSQ